MKEPPLAITRRTLISQAALAATASALPEIAAATTGSESYFPVSLAQWSLHRTYFGSSLSADFRTRLHNDPDSLLQGERDPIDFPVLARQSFGIDAVEYVNTFYFGRARDQCLRRHRHHGGGRSRLGPGGRR